MGIARGEAITELECCLILLYRNENGELDEMKPVVDVKCDGNGGFGV